MGRFLDGAVEYGEAVDDDLFAKRHDLPIAIKIRTILEPLQPNRTTELSGNIDTIMCRCQDLATYCKSILVLHCLLAVSSFPDNITGATSDNVREYVHSVTRRGRPISDCTILIKASGTNSLEDALPQAIAQSIAFSVGFVVLLSQ